MKHLLTIKNPGSWGQSLFHARTWKCLWILSIQLCLLVFLTPLAYATFPDSLGIQWGLGLSAFRQMDFDIEEEWPLGNWLTAIRLETPSQKLPDAGSLILVFDKEVGLVKTQWVSKLIKRDEPGTKGLEEFKRLKTTISEQYGSPFSTHEEQSVKLQGFHGSFYQCLQEKTCGQWKSIWETLDGGTLKLELIGFGPGIGLLQITHQGPHFSNTFPNPMQGLTSQEQET